MSWNEEGVTWDEILGTDFWGEPEERKPRQRQPENPLCLVCVDRYVISDGYGEWVHEDNGLYSCELDPRARRNSTLFAIPAFR